MNKTQDGIRVEIYDQEYFIRGQLDPEYMQELARFLDQKMRSIAQRSQTVDSLRVAILAALNIADEYQQLKQEHKTIAQQVEEKIVECSSVVDEILKQAV